MRHVEFLFIRYRPDAPLLHGELAEENLDGLAVFIFADVVHNQRISRNLMTLDFSVQVRFGVRFLNSPAESGSDGSGVGSVLRALATDGIT